MALEPVWKSIIANCTPKLWRTSYRKLFSKHALGDKLVIPDIIKWTKYIQQEVREMIHEKIEIQLKDSEFKANLFTYLF